MQPRHAKTDTLTFPHFYVPRCAKFHINTTSARRKTFYVFVRFSTGLHLTGVGLGVGAARTGARTAALGAGAARTAGFGAARLGTARAAGLGAARAAATASTHQ